ncbi:hypothetical protein C5C64_16875, partial [Rathayibacter sp. AY1D3]
MGDGAGRLVLEDEGGRGGPAVGGRGDDQRSRCGGGRVGVPGRGRGVDGDLGCSQRRVLLVRVEAVGGAGCGGRGGHGRAFLCSS